MLGDLFLSFDLDITVDPRTVVARKRPLSSNKQKSH